MSVDTSPIEDAYRIARDLADRVEVAEARGIVDDGIRSRSDEATAAFRALIMENDERSRNAQSSTHEDVMDVRALAVMRRWADRHDDDSGDNPIARIESAYANAQATVDIGGTTATRLGVLELLSIEPDPVRRKLLFHALAPVWQTIDGDGTSSGSPYRCEVLPLSVRHWRAGRSPVDANARALGLDPASVEPSLLAILEAWRSTVGTPIEPWDWWYEAGTAHRALNAAIPVERLRPINDAYYASLGADVTALGIEFDVFPRAGRPPVPVAYTDFGGRASTTPDGMRQPAKACVMATYTAGGLGELTELVHETGHAIHVAAIDTRAAFADWPDSDAFTEAIAELTALDTAEPAWQQRWLGHAIRTDVSLSGRYADVMLDICWAVLEIRLHADPSLRPNDVWTELTTTYLGLVPHPDLSWWAMRGQLVQEPGYMVNYAIGPILAADMRSAIRAARGVWIGGDPGWYSWVSEHVYRFGLERSSGEVLAALLGRAPSADALVAEIGRGAAA